MKKYIDGKYVEVINENIIIPKELQIDELKQKLNDTDYVIIKIAEGSATAEEYSDVIKERKEWRAKINKLEAECS